MTSPPLLLSRDPDLLDDVGRLAAVADVDPRVLPSVAEARRWWGSATHVLLGADLLDDAGTSRLARRPGVVVLTRADPGPGLWRAALDVGAEEVVHLPRDEGALVTRLLAAPGDGGPRARVVGVVGGSGGAGASVLAVALALAGARLGLGPVLVDLDPCGGGIDLALGCEGETGARWPDLAALSSPVPAATLLDALPAAHGVRLLAPLRGGPDEIAPASVPAVLDSLADGPGLVVLDLPRAADDLRATAVARCDVVLLVVTSDVRGSAAGRATCATLAEAGDLRLVVRAQPGCELDAEEVAGWLGLPLAAELAHDPRLTASVDRGDPPGLAPRSRLARVGAALLGSLLVEP
ncbi:MAG: septum site-determining protein Ssd [Candidatus Nanopelagicales bacterium]